MSLEELQMPQHWVQKNEFLKAWINIKALPPDHPDSFWTIASYHGQPFEQRSDIDSYWGGYCQHGNVLFPTWHRMYVKRLEDALNNHKSQDAIDAGVEIGMHYWDQISMRSLDFPLNISGAGIPALLLEEKVTIWNSVNTTEEVDNALKSYVFQKAITAKETYAKYVKEIGYETCRYPYSGITNPPDEAEIAVEHNESLKNSPLTPTEHLELNVWYALRVNSRPSTSPESFRDPPAKTMYEICLETPSYNLFSNTSSSGKYSTTLSLEQPHNDIHLATGGFDYRDPENPEDDASFDLIAGANGEMGANEVAAFDPIFFFHHCFIDLLLWRWQQIHSQEDQIIINFDRNDEGLQPKYNQGATPGQYPDDYLSANTKLYPFTKPNSHEIATTNDCANIELQLNYAYQNDRYRCSERPISDLVKWKFTRKCRSDLLELLRNREIVDKYERIFCSIGETEAEIKEVAEYLKTPISIHIMDQYWLVVDEIYRDKYPGSFVVKAFYKKKLVSQQGVLNRWNRKVCKNCQVHPKISLTFKFPNKVIGFIPNLDNVEVHIVYKDGRNYENIKKITNKSRSTDPDAPVFKFLYVINP